jgi:gliding motility-associated-like protein
MRKIYTSLLFSAFVFPLAVMGQCNFTVAVNVTNLTCYQSGDGAATAVVTGNTGPYTYIWNSNPIQNGANASNLMAGFYTVSVTDAQNCVVNETFTVTQPQALVVDVGFDTAICIGNTVQLKSLIFGGTLPFTYSWSCSNSNCGLGSNPSATPTVSPTSTSTYYLQAIDANGCSGAIDSAIVVVNPRPIVNAGDDLYTYYSESVQLNASSNTALSYSWSPSNELNASNIANPISTPTQTTTYIVTVVDGNGCIGRDTMVVEVDKNILIATGLTPNGDQINDTWEIKNIVLYPNCKVEIFNRSGNRIFRSDGYSSPWTGDENPAGTYFYILDLGVEGQPILKGSLTLIR